MYIKTITDSFNGVINKFIAFIPQLVSAIILIIIGLIVAWIFKFVIVRILKLINFQKIVKRTRIDFQRFNISPINFIGNLVYWFILIMFLVSAANSLDIPAINQLLSSIFLYIPNVIAAVLILLIGLAAANIFSDFVNGATSSTGYNFILAAITKWLIIIFVILAILQELNIVPALVNILFAAIIGSLALGVALAIGLSFGLGGRDFASQILAETYRRINEKKPAIRKLGQGRDRRR